MPLQVGYQHFYDTLSKDTAVRTEDPWWVPAACCLLHIDMASLVLPSVKRHCAVG
jgi:hypothetical protein